MKYRKNKKVLVWSTGIDNLISGKGRVGGLTVQLMHWTGVFKKNNWTVKTLTKNRNNNDKEINNIDFIYFKQWGLFNILGDFFSILRVIKKEMPELVIVRGAGRNLLYISLICRMLGIRHILMLASDTDIIKGKELIARPWDRWLYNKGLAKTKYFVAQNEYQQNNIQKRFPEADILTIPNIWPESNKSDIKKENVLWLANFRDLKRPKLFLELAKKFQHHKFIMAGAPHTERSLYDYCKEEGEKLQNFKFLGPIPFMKTEFLFQKAKIFVLTSEFEGFPNTFLQAWAAGTPVISTVDPSGVIEKYNLGFACSSPEDQEEKLREFLNGDPRRFDESISRYFQEHHSPQNHFERMMKEFDL